MSGLLLSLRSCYERSFNKRRQNSQQRWGEAAARPCRSAGTETPEGPGAEALRLEPVPEAALRQGTGVQGPGHGL